MKNNILRICLMFVFCLFAIKVSVYAANLNANLSSSTVEQGKTFTVSVNSGLKLTDFEVSISSTSLTTSSITSNYSGSTKYTSGTKQTVVYFQQAAQKDKNKIASGTNLATVTYTVANTQAVGNATISITLKGIDENGHFKLLSNTLLRESRDNFVSPSIIKFKDKYIVSYLDNRLVGKEVLFDGLYITEGKNVEDAIKNIDANKITVLSKGMIPWHMSLFQYDGVLYTVITCVKEGDMSLKLWQMLGRFDESLDSLIIFPTPLTDYNSYRGCAQVDEEGVFVLYTPTVHEKIHGSQSVDGRDVLSANVLFKELLNRINQ